MTIEGGTLSATEMPLILLLMGLLSHQLMRVMACNSRLEQKLNECLWVQKVLVVLVLVLLMLTLLCLYLLGTSAQPSWPPAWSVLRGHAEMPPGGARLTQLRGSTPVLRLLGGALELWTYSVSSCKDAIEIEDLLSGTFELKKKKKNLLPGY